MAKAKPKAKAKRPDALRSPQESPSGGHGAKSAAVRECAILALLSEKTLEDAARVADINARTLRRWLAEDAAFQAEYAAARRATFDAGMSRIQALSGKSVDTLESLLGESKFPAVRLGAAKAILEVAIHRQDAESIMQKLDAIEAQQQRGGY